MRRNSGFTLISVLFFLLRLTNPAAANAQAAGPWKGSTSQGQMVSFKVSSNQISGFTIALQLPNGLSATYTDENLVIDNLNFGFAKVLTGTSCVVFVTGTFLSDTSAAGTIVTNYCFNDPNLLITDTTWTAAPDITVTSVSPASGMAGSTVSITLQGVGFVPGDTVVQVSGTGITVSNVQTTSSSSLTATLNTDWNAAPGDRIISVSTSSTSGGALPFTVTPNPNVYSIAIPDKGGLSLSTPGTSTSSVTGSVLVSAIPGGAKLAGAAIFGLRSSNVLVTEAGVQASVPIQRGRIYAEVGGNVNTGLAIANPNSDKATISFLFTKADGTDYGSGTVTIPSNGQIAKFLNDTPFNSGTAQGTMTFSSDMPVAAIAIRSYTNERGEFLITSLPVVDLSVPAMTVDTTVPDFADGGGYTTSIILVNATDLQLTGRISFLDAAGAATSVTIAGSSSDTFSYSVPPRGSVKFATEGSAQTVRSGTVRILPGLGGFAPASLAVFSLKAGAVTVSEAGVAGTPGGSNTPSRMYIESAGFYGVRSTSNGSPRWQ